MSQNLIFCVRRGKTPKKPPAPQKATPTDPVEVYSRVRPLDDQDVPVAVKVVSPSVLQLTVPEGSFGGRNAVVGKETLYTFSFVFDEYSSQKSVFNHVAYPLVEDILKGKNALLFAYGVTGSGKTHTMTGTPQDPGILPRCLDTMFNSIGELQAKKYVFKPDKINGFDVQCEADAMLERQHRDILPQLSDTPKPLNGPRVHGRHEEQYNRHKEPRTKETVKVNEIEEDNYYTVFVSYIEIYNNYIYDLLEDLVYDPITGYKGSTFRSEYLKVGQLQAWVECPVMALSATITQDIKREIFQVLGLNADCHIVSLLPDRAPQSKILREDGNHNMYVSGVTEVEVKNTEEAYEVLHRGQKRRKVAQTALNAESSRSHSVFNIRLVQAPVDPAGVDILQDKDKVVVSQLALVDLAGSERMARTGNSGDRLREAGNINQSLMVLRTCIETLRENQQSGGNKMVPYRDSRLTHLFKNYFDGEGKVRMTVCVNPNANEYDETVHVMRFAEMTQEVQIARSQQVRFNLGLTKGRRKMAQQYQDAVALQGSDSDNIPIPTELIYSLGPPFPPLELKDPCDTLLLMQLAEYLRLRNQKRVTLLEDHDRKWEKFREQLVDVEKENYDLKLRVSELEAQVTNKDSESGRLQRRVRSLEKSNENLHRQTTAMELEKRDMEKELDDKDYRIQQVKSDNNRMKNDYKSKLALSEHNYKKDLEHTKRKLEEKTLKTLAAKNQKIEMVKNLLESEDSESLRGGVSSKPTPATAPKPSRYTMSRMYPAKSEPDLSGQTPTSTRTPLSSHLRARTTYTQPVNKINLRSRPKSPPPTKPKPVINKYHRRSRSQGDLWLDHKPRATINTGSIMQPKMKKKKSVTKLDKKDFKESNKYLLTQQDNDTDGGISTKLVKGDVCRTSSGGTAVVYTEVETIKQKSPGDRKRRSPPLHPEDFDGEWTDSEERCRIAIEGHGHMKRIRTSTEV